MNTSSGYGNFAANGIFGTSNLFSVNGMDYNEFLEGCRSEPLNFSFPTFSA